MKPNSRTRIALIGAGHIAQSHILAARALADRSEVVAVVDVDHSRLASFAGSALDPRSL